MDNNTQSEQVFQINAQYTKDLSFENVTHVSALDPNGGQPDIQVQVKTTINAGDKPDNYIVDLIFEIKAQLKETTLFIVELDYCGHFTVKGFAPELIGILLNVECPRTLFPFARSIIASVTSEGGLPPVFLSPVDFGALYAQQMEANQQPKQ